MNDTEPRLDLIMEELRLIRADLDNLRQLIEAIEQRHAKLDQGLLTLKREYDEQ
jgi:prefoldin subunit 5